MKPCLQVALFILAASMHIALVQGIKCSSNCAACWKDNDTDGVDTKFICNGREGDCGDTCPPGYHGIHCAGWERCE